MYIPQYTQYFLNDCTVAEEMLNHARINGNDMVIDIGAGKGALTRPLSQRVHRVIAVELDNKLAHSLKKLFGNTTNVKILNLNFLDMPLPNGSFKVVANIPYNITSDTFGYLLDIPHSPFLNGVIITEWGAARRFTGHSTDPRIIGWNTWFNISIVKRVSPKVFTPAPSVLSAMIKVDRRKPFLVNPNKYYYYIAFVASMLEHPEMSIRDVFKRIFTWNQINRICRDAGINCNYPIEYLTITQWAHSFNAMVKLVPERIHPAMPGKYKKYYKR